MSKKFSDLESRRAYQRQLYKVTRERGPAKSLICEGCEDRLATSWAHPHEGDLSDTSLYKPLCWSCHSEYDSRWSEEERDRVGRSVSSYYASLTEEQKADRSRKISEAKTGKPRPDMRGNRFAARG